MRLPRSFRTTTLLTTYFLFIVTVCSCGVLISSLGNATPTKGSDTESKARPRTHSPPPRNPVASRSFAISRGRFRLFLLTYMPPPGSLIDSSFLSRNFVALGRLVGWFRVIFFPQTDAFLRGSGPPPSRFFFRWVESKSSLGSGDTFSRPPTSPWRQDWGRGVCRILMSSPIAFLRVRNSLKPPLGRSVHRLPTRVFSLCVKRRSRSANEAFLTLPPIAWAVLRPRRCTLQTYPTGSQEQGSGLVYPYFLLALK